jgi:hypothetical protein
MRTSMLNTLQKKANYKVQLLLCKFDLDNLKLLIVEYPTSTYNVTSSITPVHFL